MLVGYALRMEPTAAQERTPNRLAGSSSVYLQQHAFNPVPWWPWGEDAIAEARRRKVPLFVSIGYSTCYWCHVMERESFEDPQIAALMDRVCVPVKVDREERPDLDEVFMTACQVFTQLTEGRASGGWPLHVFLDPESLRPFFCGTYYPPQPAWGRPSFAQLLNAVDAAWKSGPAELQAQAERLGAMVAAQLQPAEGGEGGEGREGVDGGASGQRAAPATQDAATVQELAALVQPTVEALMAMADPVNGGFGGAPKFPTPAYPGFLLAVRAQDAAVARVVQLQLDRMACGGIFDQVGAGFHRYAVDGTWTVPHFEKMLYDNAQLLRLYALAWQAWGNPAHQRVARRTAAYVMNEMTGAQGQFFSAQDAEVGAREGGSYVWTPQEAHAALAQAGFTPPEAAAVARAYGLDRAANFQDPHHPTEPPTHVLRMDALPEELAPQLGLSPEALLALLDRSNAALLAVRATRPQPLTDDKAIAAWNGLMMEALAAAGRLLDHPALVQAAARAAQCVLQHMRTPDGRLCRLWRSGKPSGAACLEDYACVANGLLALHAADGQPHWLAEAAALVRTAHGLFADPRTGTWYDVAAGQNQLWVRSRSLDDSAVPSGTSSMVRALLTLAEAGRAAVVPPLPEATAWAQAALVAAAPVVRQQPVACSGLVVCAVRLTALLQLPGAPVCTPDGCTWPSASSRA